MKIFVFNFLVFVACILMQVMHAEAANEKIRVPDSTELNETTGAARQAKLSAEDLEKIIANAGANENEVSPATNNNEPQNIEKSLGEVDGEVKQQVEAAAIAANAKENEIPVFKNNTQAKSNAASGSSSSLFMTFVILATFAIAGIVAIKKFAKHKTNDVNGKIKVLTQHYLGPKKSLALVRIAGESILIGITENNITHIKTLSLLDEDLPEEVPNHFSNTLGDYAMNDTMGDDMMNEKENFLFGGIKDVVHTKIKNMRQF